MQKILKSACFTLLLLVSMVNIISAQSRDVGNFSGVSTSGNLDVKLIKSDNPSVKIKMIKGNAEDVITTVKGNDLTLKIKNKWGVFNNKTKAKIIVYYTELNDIDASAGSSIIAENEISSNKLDIDASSGSSINLGIAATDLEVDCSSGASVVLKGETKNADYDASSGASIVAKNVVAKRVRAEASSGASIGCHADDKIKAEASSGASISYRGEPSEKDISKGVSGSVGRSN